MKTKKQLLEFLLKELGLWKAFEKEVEKLHIYEDAPEWDCIDENLDFLFNAIGLLAPDNKEICVANRLKDNTYLDQLVCNEDIGLFMLTFAVVDLCNNAGLNGEEFLRRLPDKFSIMEVVDGVYNATHA